MNNTARLIVATAALTIATASIATVSSAKPTPVELWRGGDDGLTIRLSEAIEAAIRNSSVFAFGAVHRPGNLIVTIPTNVPWKQIGNRTQVLYEVEFMTSRGRDLGASKGACWDDELSSCAKQILRDARAVSEKMR